MSTEPKTSRGRESRERILSAAADLIHRHGVHGTSIDQVLDTSGAGKSQFYHYFDGKDDLVRGVLDFQVHRIFDHQAPYLEHLDSFEGIAAWLADIVASHEERHLVGGCPIGTLAAEMVDWDSDLAEDIDAVFSRWRTPLAQGLRRMQRRGELRDDADPESLAELVVAVQQGGVLLARTGKDIAPLRSVLDHALRYLASYRTGAPKTGATEEGSSEAAEALRGRSEGAQPGSDWATWM